MKKKMKSLNNIIISYVIGFTFIISFAFLAYDIFTEFQNNKTQKQESIDQVSYSYLDFITAALWEYDVKRINIVLKSLTLFEHIESVVLVAHGNTRFSKGKVPVAGDSSVEQKNILVKKGDREIGMLTLYVSNEVFYSKILNKLFFLFITRLLKTFLLSIFLYALLKRLVIDPLARMKTEIQKGQVGDIDIERGGAEDEISFLIKSINKLKESNLSQLRNIERSQELVSKYNRNLIAVQEKERKNISLFLHDSIGQQMSSIKLYCQMKNYPIDFISKLDKLNEGIKHLSYNIMPAPMMDLSFQECLDWLLGSTFSVDECHVVAAHACDELNLDIKINLYRIVQELLQNSMKHSKVKFIKIHITYENEQYQLMYNCTSTGRQEAVGDKQLSAQLGSLSINERIQYIDGYDQSEIDDEHNYSLNFRFSGETV
jgi:signal transduction histidine kinase